MAVKCGVEQRVHFESQDGKKGRVGGPGLGALEKCCSSGWCRRVGRLFS